ncbi:MAG: aminopeptidase, partial [Pseudomonadota bacterium]
MRLILTAAAALLLSACSDAPDGGDVPPEADAATPAPAPTETVTADPHSFANVTAVTTTHLVLDLDVDFEARQLRGSAVHTLDRSEGASQFVVDSRDLTIDAVTDAATGEALAWTIGDAVEYLGAPLTIGLEGETETVRIDYATAPGASGLQWLEPGQTAGGEHPFLFSQAQAQHA